jgi:NDP-sugar pyrophosphorylase family protein
MHGLILAGGEGSRLARDGFVLPKPAVEIGGVSLLERQATMLRDIGCATLTSAIRSDALAYLVDESHPALALVHALPVDTPSSLHTLVLGLAEVPAGPVCCTMVDTVMSREHWHRFAAEAARALEQGADACVLVTPFVDDEKPLYAVVDEAGAVIRFGAVPGSPVLVTGGVYMLGSRARRHAAHAMERGVVRMRGFLQSLIDTGLGVSTVTVDWVVDVDRRQDVELADRRVERVALPRAD